MYWFSMFEGIVAHEWEKVKRKPKKFSKETKKPPQTADFFVPLSFLRVLIFINESVELSDRRL